MRLTRHLDLTFSLASLLLLAVAEWAAGPQFDGIVFLAVLLTVGVPHGAIDHLIDLKSRVTQPRDLAWFLTKYLSLAGLMGLVWWLFPSFTFLLFIGISAYHFGQSQLYQLQLSPLVKNLLYAFWGLALLSGIVVLNMAECQGIFDSLGVFDMTLVGAPLLWQSVFMASAAGVLLIFLGGVLQSRVAPKRFLVEMLVLGALYAVAWLGSAVLAFALYFGLWHSLKSLLLEYGSLKREMQVASAWGFIKQLVPFSALALGGMFVLYLAQQQFYPGVSPYMLFIVLISMLTLPHLFVMHGLFAKVGAQQ